VLLVYIYVKFHSQPQLIGSAQPIEVVPGDDVILPCHVEPVQDVVAMTIEWSRPDLDPMFVYLWRARQDNTYMKNPMYTGRTSLSVDELKKGNMSLKLTNVQLSDRGTYTCLFLANNLEMSVELIVATSSKPVVKLVGIGKPSGSVVLECMSSGWYPEPEVSWMDSEGHLVSTGPPETVRGPDDLYTVSSRVTVDKRHGSTVTCRVHQDRTNQTRQTWIRVSGRNHNMVFLLVLLVSCLISEQTKTY
uniref:Ig-like domain-containing protein n=1 Tax=Sphaeramia orbicularis TaxID=375764 RepID=A0A672ZB58_9TELE